MIMAKDAHVHTDGMPVDVSVLWQKSMINQPRKQAAVDLTSTSFSTVS